MPNRNAQNPLIALLGGRAAVRRLEDRERDTARDTARREAKERLLQGNQRVKEPGT